MAETEFQIGRGPGNSIPVIWDREVSREHAILKRVNEQIHVTCLPKATNPIVLNGAPVREVVVEDGDKFTIGKTTFCLESGGQRDDDDVVDEIRLDENDLSGTEFGDPGRQMDLLCSLPEVISTAGSDIELATLLAEFLRLLPWPLLSTAPTLSMHYAGELQSRNVT